MTGPVLVTGATGFLGEHLLDALAALATPPSVRVLTRRPSRALVARGVDVVVGSILDPATVRRAVEGVEAIYHLAGLVSRDPDDGPAMMRLHVEGTRLVCDASLAAHVGRLVVASTSGTIGVSTDPERIASEADRPPLELLRRWPYYLSKVYQEELVLRLVRERGLDAVLVNPTLLLGPGDRRLSSTGDVRRIVEGKIPFVPSGGVSFVDARDVAALLPIALERGRKGERYLLGAANWTMKELCGRVARIAGVQGPLFRVPDRFALAGARLVERLYRLRGAEAPFDEQSVEMSQYFWYIDSAKAERELDFAPRDPGETLRDTIRFLRRHRLGARDQSDPSSDGRSSPDGDDDALLMG